MWAAIGGGEAGVDQVAFRGTGSLPSAYAVTDFAAASIATAGLAIAELLQAALAPASEADLAPEIETTPWGPARRVRAPLLVGEAPLRWASPARELRSAAPAWRARRESNPHLRV